MATAKQIAARELFAKRARSGTFKRKSGKSVAPRKRKRNPVSQVAQTILEQLGGNKFLTMTGAKHLLGDDKSLTFTLPARASRDGINKVRVTLRGDDTYHVQFMKYSPRTLAVTMIAMHEHVQTDQLREVFTTETGMHVSLGKMPSTRTIGKYVVGGSSLGVWQWVTDAVSRQAPVLGQWSNAMYMTAERAAVVKSRLDAEGYNDAQAIPVEEININPRTRTAKNPSSRTSMRNRMAHQNPRARTVTHVELRSDGDDRFKYGADQSTVQLWTFSPVETKRAYRSFRIPPGIVKNPDFQAWVRGLNYVASCTYPQLLDKVKRFA